MIPTVPRRIPLPTAPMTMIPTDLIRTVLRMVLEIPTAPMVPIMTTIPMVPITGIHPLMALTTTIDIKPSLVLFLCISQ